MRATLSILAVLVVAAVGANAQQLLSNGGFDRPITVLNFGNAGGNPPLNTLLPGIWYTAQRGWDQSWSIQTDALNNNYLQYGAPMQTFSQETIQYIPIPAAGDWYTFSFDYRCTTRPLYGHGASVRLLDDTGVVYPTFYSTPGSEVDVYTEDLISTSGQWMNQSFSFDITADQETAFKYLMVIFYADGPGDLSIDNVRLTSPALTVIPGDANGDGVVDVGDLAILGYNYGTTIGATWRQADFTGDGAVDVGDLGVLGDHFISSGVVICQIPEPATLSLLGLGALSLIRRKR